MIEERTSLAFCLIFLCKHSVLTPISFLLSSESLVIEYTCKKNKDQHEYESIINL